MGAREEWMHDPLIKQAMADGPAGWYPDPAGGRGRRYWDGAKWTDRVDPRKTSNQISWIVVGLAILMLGGCVALRVFGGDGGIKPTDSDGPVMTSHPGTGYKIGDGVPAGTWETKGAAVDGGDCVWARRADMTNEPSNFIDMGTVGRFETKRVAVKTGEYFISTGCLPWHYVG